MVSVGRDGLDAAGYCLNRSQGEIYICVAERVGVGGDN